MIFDKLANEVDKLEGELSKLDRKSLEWTEKNLLLELKRKELQNISFISFLKELKAQRDSYPTNSLKWIMANNMFLDFQKKVDDGTIVDSILKSK